MFEETCPNGGLYEEGEEDRILDDTVKTLRLDHLLAITVIALCNTLFYKNLCAHGRH